MGRSIINNPSVFYDPVHKWVSELVTSSQEKTTVDLGFDYINSGSTKWLYILLRELSGMDDLTHRASVSWYYEEGDEDMLELGHIIKSLMECPFRLVQVEYMDDGFYRSVLSGPQQG